MEWIQVVKKLGVDDPGESGKKLVGVLWARPTATSTVRKVVMMGGVDLQIIWRRFEANPSKDLENNQRASTGHHHHAQPKFGGTCDRIRTLEIWLQLCV